MPATTAAAGASSCLIDGRGDARFGVFTEPVLEVNYRDFALLSPHDRPRGAVARHFGFNQFQFLGGLSPALLFGCAIADIKYVATAFVYFYEPATRRFSEFSFRSPLGVCCRFDQRPEDGSTTFRSGGNHFAMTATHHPQQRHLWVKLAGGVEIDALFDEQSPRLQPMWICTPAGATGWVYARKTAGASVRGTAVWEGRRFDLAELGMLGHNDWSAGYMRRETFWNWACLAGRLADGRVVGMNLSCGVNETSHTESCFWIDGVLHPVGTVAFDYDRRDLTEPWRVRGRGIDLTFVPEGRHSERVNALVVATNFQQLFGRYTGTMTTAGGESLTIESLYGYMERHYAKW
ncbi:MAG TPA: DUF2804 domain-containing protein [Candidatus Limnocylindrales bacterium]|nr:DUF2804 domain-containing protein [Candidatus Limnocylindrales bacterium]